MIALEVSELQGAPTCGTCHDGLRRELGCRKPGYEDRGYVRKRAPVTFTSPLLVSDPKLRVMTECPVGYLLREAPWVHDALEASSLVENCTPREFALLPAFIREVARIRASELARFREAKREQERAKRDSQLGKDVRRR